MAALAPSSPRLPSPPPAAEIQIGPKSPSMGTMSNRQAQQMEQTALDANSKRRIHPGTKAGDMAAGPPLVPLSELDSAFQLQEHLAALHYFHTESNTSPINRDTAKLLATPPQGIDRTLWLYELCRFTIEQCNGLIVGFLFDSPACSAATCPEMRASEWQFLCAVHDQPKSCCAIDYCCHTLDWAANVVTNPQLFPSRFVALSDGHDKGAAVKNLVNVFRRLHRIFAHAWFQHRGVFWTTEGQTGLYVFFKTVCDLYDLLPGENYKLPPEAEGLEAPAPANSSADLYKPQEPLQPQSGPHHLHNQKQESGGFHPVAIARPPRNNSKGVEPSSDADDEYLNAANSRTNTRRHIRSSPSTGSAVTTVMEADEDDSSGDFASRFKGMQIVDPTAGEDDLDAAEVPVIVEHGIPIRRISGVGTGGGGKPQADALPPIRIATLENAGDAEPTKAGADTSSEDTILTPADSEDEAPPTALEQKKGSEESFLDGPDDVDTPVQGDAHDTAEKSETAPEPAPAAPESKDVESDKKEGETEAATTYEEDHGIADAGVVDKDASAVLAETSVTDFGEKAEAAKPNDATVSKDEAMAKEAEDEQGKVEEKDK